MVGVRMHNNGVKSKHWWKSGQGLLWILFDSNPSFPADFSNFTGGQVPWSCTLLNQAVNWKAPRRYLATKAKPSAVCDAAVHVRGACQGGQTSVGVLWYVSGWVAHLGGGADPCGHGIFLRGFDLGSYLVKSSGGVICWGGYLTNAEPQLQQKSMKNQRTLTHSKSFVLKSWRSAEELKYCLKQRSGAESKVTRSTRINFPGMNKWLNVLSC